MLRLGERLDKQLVGDIEALRVAFPGIATSSVADYDDLKCRDPMDECASGNPTLADGFGQQNYGRVPLTKNFLDLMDAPIPSGVLAEEFAYHGLAPSFLKEMHQARELLDKIYTEIKK